MTKTTHKEAEDSFRTYEWSPGGILVRHKQGTYAGYYKLRAYDPDNGQNEPTRLILTGYSFGECPAELAIHWITINEIEKHILDLWKKEDVG